ncbi:MAG: response regulator [Turneriella sp.]|nr:response regulator [Turneriella sp.]
MAGAERILILEDDAIYARTLAETLSPLGEARFTSYPERVPEIIAEFHPTLLIVDYNLNHPTLNGIKATKLVRQNSASSFLPVLLLSGEDDMAVIEEAYKSGIDDYVLKPVIPRFLIAKIENLLFQTRKKLNAQALSGLPGNAAIETEFYLRLQKKKPFSAAYTDLDNFKPFNDEKGVKKGDDAIQCVARILYELRAAVPRDQLFVGHIGGDDFFMLGSPTRIRAATKRLHKLFAAESAAFFSDEENKAGYYRGTDRQGQICSFPLLTISTAILENITRTHVADFQTLAEIAAVAKKNAKKSATRMTQVNIAELPKSEATANLFKAEEGRAKKNRTRGMRKTK